MNGDENLLAMNTKFLPLRQAPVSYTHLKFFFNGDNEGVFHILPVKCSSDTDFYFSGVFWNGKVGKYEAFLFIYL